MASGLKSNEMPAGWYRIIVVCEHVGRSYQGKRRVVDRLQWVETDPEDEADYRAVLGKSGDFDEAALQVIMLNERFSRREEWKNESGRTVRPASTSLVYEAAGAIPERARALGGFRFKCACGIDRPVRQQTLDSWIRARLGEDASRRVHEFEISH